MNSVPFLSFATSTASLAPVDNGLRYDKLQTVDEFHIFIGRFFTSRLMRNDGVGDPCGRFDRASNPSICYNQYATDQK